MSIDVYSFEDANGNEIGTYTTQDIGLAREYAQNNRLKLIANVYEWADSQLVEDYTGSPE